MNLIASVCRCVGPIQIKLVGDCFKNRFCLPLSIHGGNSSNLNLSFASFNLTISIRSVSTALFRALTVRVVAFAPTMTLLSASGAYAIVVFDNSDTTLHSFS